MDISAPIVNRLMPNTRKVAPIKKRTISPAEIGVSVIDRTRTIIAIGNTDFSDSVRLCLMRFLGKIVSVMILRESRQILRILTAKHMETKKI